MKKVTNIQRICEACILNGIYSPDEIKDFLEKDGKLPVHTRSVWLTIGKSIKKEMEDKGIKTKLWIKSKEDKKYYLVDVVLYPETMVEQAS